MVRVTLEPFDANAGGRRVFQTVRAHYTPNKGELILVLRDGQMCLALQGSWSMAFEDSRVMAHSIDEAERIHEGSHLVVMAH